MIEVVRDIVEYIKYVTGDKTINCCNLNYYPEGGGIGYHADDEFLFDSLKRPTRIVSLSLTSGGGGGDDALGQRLFQVKARNGCTEDEAAVDNTASKIYEVLLDHGDIITMEGYFQQHYYHSVWPGDSKQFLNHEYTRGERINLTFRTIVQHLNGIDDESNGKYCPLSAS